MEDALLKATGEVRLAKLLINEISGVDDPANELNGWAVQKSKDGKVDPDFAARAETFEKAVESVVNDRVAVAVETLTKSYNEILEAALNRIEALESRSATRKSIEGQETPEDGAVQKSTKDQIGDRLMAMGRTTAGFPAGR
jgi:hypothetical protein